jgi:hypothetical protein
MMKQSGGAGDEAHIYDIAIRNMISYIQTIIPTTVSDTASSIYSNITVLKILSQDSTFGYFINIGKEIFSESLKTGVVTADIAAAEIGGIVGEAAVSIPSAIAIFFVVITHVLDDELGEAFVSSLLAIPFIGPVMYKAAGSLGRVANKVIGAKRFSTRRRKVHKWRRTRSVRH